nr:hypothetical protein Itr_chr07CG13140 [Ipomoea trifida]GMD19318.1 hypothetical protein Iba_chr07eCG7110 [Ipomoea batatas]
MASKTLHCALIFFTIALCISSHGIEAELTPFICHKYSDCDPYPHCRACDPVLQLCDCDTPPFDPRVRKALRESKNNKF